MRSVYRSCLSYAYKCAGPELFKDIVQDAWLRNYESDGTNLFDKPLPYAIRAIKYRWLNEITDRRYMYKGELYYKQYTDAADLNISHSNTSDQQLITSQFYEELYSLIDQYQVSKNYPKRGVTKENLKDLVIKLDQGWSIPEISKQTGIPTKVLHYYKTKIRKIIDGMEYRNPFAGSKVKISKKVTRKTLESNPEKYKDYVFDVDKGCDSNEYYQVLVLDGKDEYLLVKEPERDYEFK